MPNTQTVKLEVVRTQGNTVLKFSIPQVIRDLWAARNLESATSASWSGLEFWKLPTEARTPQYNDLLAQFNLRDDFGSALIDADGRFNVAFLRCKSAEGEIPCPTDMSFSVLSENVRTLARFVRQYVEQNVSDFRITGSVLIEL